MPENLTQLDNLLKEELHVFSQLLSLEQEKSNAIINKDGHLLQKLSQQQEQYLGNISIIEKNRKNLTDNYFKKDLNNNPSLKEIALKIGQQGSDLLETGDNLRKILNKIRSLQETNSKMIHDNLEFFSRMVNDLKNSVTDETGYSNKGVKKSKTTNPLVLDKKI